MPYHQLPITPYNPPEADPLGQYAKLVTLRNAIQGGQLQQQQLVAAQQENQMRAMQMRDQQAMDTAVQEWDPSTGYGGLIEAARKHRVSAKTVMGLQEHANRTAKELSDTLKNNAEAGLKQIETRMKANDVLVGGINGVLANPDEQLGPALAQFVQGAAQQGMLDPQHAQMGMQLSQQAPDAIRKALPIFAKGYRAESQQMKAAAEAETARHNLTTENLTARGQDITLRGQDLTNKRMQEANATARGERADRQRDAATEQSYKFHTSAVDKLAAPIDQAQQRMERLQATLDSNSPQGDALVAPELLTIMAGGMGSGLRMNEAEISRIIGGRSKWESLKAAINKWNLDPKTANSITPEQRQQIRALTGEVQKQMAGRQQLLNTAREEIANSTDPQQHKQIYSRLRQQLGASGQQQELPRGNGGVIDSATAQQFYQAAGGDPNKARQMAQQYGWKVQ